MKEISLQYPQDVEVKKIQQKLNFTTTQNKISLDSNLNPSSNDFLIANIVFKVKSRTPINAKILLNSPPDLGENILNVKILH